MSPKPKTESEIIKDIKEHINEIDRAMRDTKEPDNELTYTRWLKLRRNFTRRLAEIINAQRANKE